MYAKFANCFLSCCILRKTDRNKPLVGEEEDVVDLVVDACAFSNPDSPQYFNDQTELVLRNAVNNPTDWRRRGLGKALALLCSF